MSRIGTIQILRALAALMVVFSHAQSDAMRHALDAGDAFARNSAVPWVSGVDLFFVTSGFIMVHASQRLFGTAAGPGIFLRRRLIRIVPLYWLVTAMSLAAVIYEVHAGKKAFPPLSEIAGSFGFVPYARPGDGQMRPLAALGWTLNYEMFFYFVFAAFVRFRARVAAAGAASALVLIVAAGAIFPPHGAMLAFWSDPIILEFVLGMSLAVLWERGFRLRRVWAVALAAVALALLSLDAASFASVPLDMSEPNGFSRLAGCGAPMALLFASVVFAEPAVAPENVFLVNLTRAGDASYALYLFHPFVIVVTRKIYLAAHLERHAGYWPMVMLDIAAAIAVSVAIHVFAERPVTAFLQRQYGARRAPAPPSGAASPI